VSLPDRTLCWVEGPPWDRSCEPVADDVTVLVERNERLRTALQPFADIADRMHGYRGESPLLAVIDECRAARAALKGESA